MGGGCSRLAFSCGFVTHTCDAMSHEPKKHEQSQEAKDQTAAEPSGEKKSVDPRAEEAFRKQLEQMGKT